MTPIIGVTCSYDSEKGAFWVRSGYMRALMACGATPLMLPWSFDPEVFERTMGLVDGLLLTGGADIDPAAYSATRCPHCMLARPERDAFEFSLLRQAHAQGLPVLGICRGMQLINVCRGGTLCQDLPTEREGSIAHMLAEPLDAILHDVEIYRDSMLAQLVGAGSLAVNSRHHQGVCGLGEGLVAMAEAPDGLVEAIGDPSARFVCGVQWHPENLWESDPRHRAVFQAFVDACRGG